MADVSREDLELEEEGEEEKKALEEAQKALQPLTDYMKKVGWAGQGGGGRGGAGGWGGGRRSACALLYLHMLAMSW